MPYYANIPTEKWAKDLNTHFIKEDIWAANKNMKKYQFKKSVRRAGRVDQVVEHLPGKYEALDHQNKNKNTTTTH
jgi:hypothetical protein